MGKSPLSCARPLAALCACAVLALMGSLAAADVGTVSEGISAYDRGDNPLAFAILDDLAQDADPTALAKAGRM